VNKQDLIKRRKELNDRKRPASLETIQRQFGAVKDGRAVIATETPIEIYDQSRGWIKQVLLMDGVVFRNGKKQLPIVDSHNDKTVRNVFGSIRNISIEGDQLIGDPDFASDAESQIVRTRFDEGHLTDFSIDAVILERQLVPQGQSYTTTSGQVIEGPAEIVTKWEPHNASICATGADPNSTVRRSSDRKEVTRMDESLMKTLAGLGVPEGMTDPSAIIAFLAGKLSGSVEEESSEQTPLGEVENMEGEKPAEEVAERAEHTGDEMKVEKMEEEVKAEVERQLKADKVRRQTILNHCKLAKLERSFADSLIEDQTVTVEIAQERIIRAMAQQPLGAVTGSNLRVTESEQDKFEAAAKAGFTQRCFQGNITKTQAEKAEGDSHFKSLGVYRLAEACVRRMGIDPEKHSKSEVARMAMGHKPTLDRVKRAVGDAYHTTGSFQNILFDGLNNTLRAAYDEAPYTWSFWVRQRQSVEDFKDIHATQLSEFQNLEVVPEGKEYPEKKMSDRRKTYNIDKFGANFSVTWETIVNDNLDALSRIPTMQGTAARRTQEKLVYDTFLSNPLMPDGVALFSASHASGRNITAVSPAAPSETTLDEGFELMSKQVGLNGSLLNLIPSVLLVPQKYSATALRITNSLSFAQSNGNEGISSLYGVNGVRPLQVVTTALLDNNNTTNWYLIASSSLVDTAEIVFLQGEESPVLENEWTMLSDKWDFKIRQSMGCAMIDHVGFYGNRT
jgi:hypothetical protein